MTTMAHTEQQTERPRIHTHRDDDAVLAKKIVVAIKDLDAAIVAKDKQAKIAGQLLLEAQNRHRGRTAFQKFLKQAGGVQYSRAMELIGIATGKKTHQKVKAGNVARQQKRRDKIKKSEAKQTDLKLVRDVTDGDEEPHSQRREAQSRIRRNTKGKDGGGVGQELIGVQIRLPRIPA